MGPYSCEDGDILIEQSLKYFLFLTLGFCLMISKYEI